VLPIVDDIVELLVEVARFFAALGVGVDPGERSHGEARLRVLPAEEPASPVENLRRQLDRLVVALQLREHERVDVQHSRRHLVIDRQLRLEEFDRPACQRFAALRVRPEGVIAGEVREREQRVGVVLAARAPLDLEHLLDRRDRCVEPALIVEEHREIDRDDECLVILDPGIPSKAIERVAP